MVSDDERGKEEERPRERRRSDDRDKDEDRSRSRERRRDRSSDRGKKDDRRRSRSRSREERSRRSRSPRRSPSPYRRDSRRSLSPPRRPSSPARPGCQLFVAGFNFVCNERDVIRKFSKYGHVKDVRLVRGPGGESRGFGFVDMDQEDEARAAIRGLDQTDWNGRKLLVEVAKRPRTY